MSEAWSWPSPGKPLPRAAEDSARRAILHAAASLAVADGVAGVSVSSLAAAVGMSKARLSALFGSAQQLQLAVVDEAARVFAEEVIRPALAAPPGLSQLAAVCEAFFAHLDRGRFPGGCLMSGVALDMNGRSGPVAELIAAFQARSLSQPAGAAGTAPRPPITGCPSPAPGPAGGTAPRSLGPGVATPAPGDELIIGIAQAASYLGYDKPDSFRRARTRHPIPGERTTDDGRPCWTPQALRSWQSKRKIAGHRKPA